MHGINWARYLDRIRRQRRGLQPEPLPVMKMVECRVCNVSVKYMREHLKNAHKITEKDYKDLFRSVLANIFRLDNYCIAVMMLI